MTDEDLLRALLEIDSELREALVTAINDDPEGLRAKLFELGYGKASVEAREDENGQDVAVDEKSLVSEEQDDWNPEADLTPAEETLYEVVKSLSTPRTASQVREEIKIKPEYSEFLEQYSSLDNRGWISSKLNKFAKAGLVGKFREGREVFYTHNIKDAVRNWARVNDLGVRDLSIPEHSDRLVTDMNMNREAVQWAIRSLNDA